MAKIPAKAKNINNQTLPNKSEDNKFENINLLPEIYRTDSNKRLFSNTIDNFTSKGNLEQINGFVGKKSGGYFRPNSDRYLPDVDKRYQFTSAPVSKDEENIYSVITLNDIDNFLKSNNITDINYNENYDDDSYIFNLPINIDKFVNFYSYVWIDDQIFIEIENIDFANYVGKVQGSIANQNLKNGIVYKFNTASNGSSINLRNDSFDSNNLYVINGVGKYIEFIPITTADYYSSFVSRVEEDIFPPQYICMERGAKNNNAWSRNNYWVHNNVIKDYKKLLKYNKNLNYKIGSWVYQDNVFYKKITNGYPNVDLLKNDVVNWVEKYDLSNNYASIRAQRSIIEFDNRIEMYNSGKQFLLNVDFIVYGGLVNDINNIVSNGYFVFEKEVELSNLPSNYFNYDSNNYARTLQEGDTFLFVNGILDTSNKIYKFTNNTLVEINHNEDDVIRIVGLYRDLLSTNVYELYFKNNSWIDTQTKTFSNENILYNLYDYNKQPISDYPSNSFAGTTIFEYKKGTGSNDIYLGYPLSYKSTDTTSFNVNNNGYVEFSYTAQNKISYVEDGRNIKILGHYYIKLLSNNIQKEKYSNCWEKSYVKEHTKKYFTQVYSKEYLNKDFKIDIGNLNKLGYGTKFQVTVDNNQVYFYYVRDNYNYLKVQNANPSLYILENSDYTFKVSTDYLTTGNFQIVDQDDNIITDGVINNNIHNGEITINLPNQILFYKFNNVKKPIYIVKSNNLPGYIKIYKNGVIQQEGSMSEVVNKEADYYYDGNFAVFPFNDSEEKNFNLENDGAVKFSETTNSLISSTGLKENDVFNVEYITYDVNDKNNFDTPLSLEHNWKNEEITDVTYNEIFSHNLSKIQNNPLLEGNSLGNNNYYNINSFPELGGKIFQFNSNSASAYISFANNKCDVINSLRFAKSQYRKFKNNFARTLARTLFTINSIEPYDIVNYVLEKINIGKNNSSIFSNSDMIYYTGLNEKVYNSDATTLQFKIDDNVLNHVYVYVQETNLSGALFYKQKLRGIDYELVNSAGDVVNENYTHVKFYNTIQNNLKIKIIYNNTKNYSYCPPTPTKLGMMPSFRPDYNFNILGEENISIDYALIGDLGEIFDQDFGQLQQANLSLFGYDFELIGIDPISNFNIVSSNNEILKGHDGSLVVKNNDIPDLFYQCIIEFENRIYNNLSIKKTSYDLELDPEPKYYKDSNKTNKILEKSFTNYINVLGINTLYNTEFILNNYFTYNFSKLGLPGNYKGIYKFYLNTYTPHITPWECFGYSEKPIWWDTWYDWRDTANGGDDNKRQNLINSLIFGFYNNPAEGKKQNITLVKTELANQINNLVSVDGSLQDPVTAGFVTLQQLNTLTEKDVKSNWKFGDGSKLELAYRNSSDFVFDYCEASYLNYPIIYFNNNWITNNNETIVNDQIVKKSTKTRLYESSDLHSNNVYVPGINQVNVEYLNFLNQNVAQLKLLFDNLSTLQVIDLLGYSKKSLVNLQFDTLINQEKSNFIPEEDYSFNLYQSTTFDSIFYSAVRIVKLDAGYSIIGYNPEDKAFTVQKVLTGAENVNVKVVDDIYVQEPSKFENETIRVLYETKFNNIQGVYTFLIQYGEYLQRFGLVFDESNNISNWRTIGKQFVLWAKDTVRQKGEYFIASPNKNKIVLELPFGVIDSFQNKTVGVPVAIGKNNDTISLSNLKISRTNNETVINSADVEIYGTKLNKKYYQHIIIANNTTKFNDIICSNLLGVKKPRLKIIGKKTENWSGKPSANGYVVKDDSIVENFESSANNFTQYNAIESSIANSQLQKTSRYNVGFTKPDFLRNLNINNDSAYEFYLGSIHDKGTDTVFTKLLRNSNLFNKNSNFQINTKDEWLFRLGELGDVEGQDTIEFEIPKRLFKTNPQTINFTKQSDTEKDYQADDKITILNNDKKWIWKPNNTSLLDHKIYLGILNDSQQNFQALKRLTINNDLAGKLLIFLKGHQYTIFPDPNLVQEMDSGKLLITTINGSGKTSTLTTHTKGVTYEDNKLVFNVPYDCPERLFLTYSTANSSIIGVSILVLPNSYLTNDHIFRSRPYLEFKDNNIFFTQYKEDLPNAGYPMVGDAEYEIRDMTQLPDIDLSLNTTFSLDNWENDLEYREGDLVRYNGKLFRAIRNIPSQPPFDTTVYGDVQSGDAMTFAKVSNKIPLIGSTFKFDGDEQIYTMLELITHDYYSYTAVIFPTVVARKDNGHRVTINPPTPMRFEYLGPNGQNAIYYDDPYWLCQSESGLFSVWLSDYNNKGFNVLQLMDYDDSENSFGEINLTPPRNYIYEICAGNEAGDIALVKCYGDHYLKVGDYILISGAKNNNNLNSIHKVTALPEGIDSNGKSLADTFFFIDEFIVENDYQCKFFAFKPTRFSDLQELSNTTKNPSYFWRDGNLAYVDRGPSGNWEVYNHNRSTGLELWLKWNADDYMNAVNNQYGFNTLPDGTVGQRMERTHPMQVNNTAIDNVTIYNKNENTILIELEVYDPFKGLIPGIADRELDFKSWYDPADYNETNDPDIQLNKETSWNNELIGKTWWNLNTVRYYNYEQGDSEYRRKYWGKQFSISSIDVYEWTKSPVPPQEYAEKVGELFEGNYLEGEAYKVIYGIDTYYYYSSNVELNPITKTYDTFYYFWVKNKLNVPSLPNRSISITEIAGIINNPTSRGIRWCAPISESELIVANIEDIINENSAIQVNLNLTGNSDHLEWFTLRENDNTSNIPELFKKKMTDSLLGFRKQILIKQYYNLVDSKQEAVEVNDVYEDSLSFKIITDNSNNIVTEDFYFKPNSIVRYKNIFYTTFVPVYGNTNSAFPDITQQSGYDLPEGIWYPWSTNLNYDTDNDNVNDAYALTLPSNVYYSQFPWIRISNVVNLDDTVVTSELFDKEGYESSLYTNRIIGVENYSEIPNKFTNELVKYGNKIYPNQSWIKNIIKARKVFVEKFNEIAINYNIIDSFSYWKTTSNNFKNTNYISGFYENYDITEYWTYAEWFSKDFTNKTITKTINNNLELLTITPLQDEVIRVLNDNNLGSAIYYSTEISGSYQWKKVYKEKGTIKLLDNLWDTRQDNGFDVEIFDSETFDNGPEVAFEVILNEITYKMLINEYKSLYLELWFTLIKYILSEQDNVDWIIKTSFIQLRLVSDGQINPGFFDDEDVEALVDYVNAYKPFHTKIRRTFNSKIYYDVVNAFTNEINNETGENLSHKLKIVNNLKHLNFINYTIDLTTENINNKFVKFLPEFPGYFVFDKIYYKEQGNKNFYLIDYEVIDDYQQGKKILFNSLPDLGNSSNSKLFITLTSGYNTDLISTGIYNTFKDISSESIDGNGTLESLQGYNMIIDPINFNHLKEEASINMTESLEIKVQTNANVPYTFSLLGDGHKFNNFYIINDSSKTQLVTDIDSTQTNIEVLDASVFSSVYLEYGINLVISINSEVIIVNHIDGNTLKNCIRGAFNTSNSTHSNGTIVIDKGFDKQIKFPVMNSISTLRYPLFNDLGSTLENSTNPEAEAIKQFTGII